MCQVVLVSNFKTSRFNKSNFNGKIFKNLTFTDFYRRKPLCVDELFRLRLPKYDIRKPEYALSLFTFESCNVDPL